MASRTPWDSPIFLLAILGYLAVNLWRAIAQSRDGAEVVFYLFSFLLQLHLFRSIRRFALSPPGSPESNRASGRAVCLGLCILVAHTWKVLMTWLMIAAFFVGFYLLLNISGE